MSLSRRWILVAAAAGSLLGCEGGTALNGGAADPPSQPMTMTTTTTAPDAATPATPEAGPPPLAPAEAQAELMQRWNRTVDATPTATLDFHWGAPDQFPHPTYKGGTGSAYHQFADILVAFLGNDDNFDFMQRNQLFTLHLRYIFPSGQNGLDTSFEGLAADFSDKWVTFAMLTPDTQQAFRDISARIESALGH